MLVAILDCAPAAAPAGEPAPFFAYLERERPALIAFNPSRLDPRLPSVDAYPAEMLRADLVALRPAFDGLVLYDYRAQITPAIIEQAIALGYRAVLLGVWDPRSATELAGVADLVRRYGDRLAFAVCIGNEGINDNRYRMEDLAAARDGLRGLLEPGSRPPVTTTEPAGDYGWPPLRAFGDFMAPNIHPAIDQEGLGADAAVGWVRGRAEAIARAAGKPVLVKETGLPHGGSSRFTPERQQAFWAAWLARDRLEQAAQPAAFISYAAAFEAFDAPWKAAQLQTPMEGQWGLMSIERVPYPAFQAWASASPTK